MLLDWGVDLRFPLRGKLIDGRPCSSWITMLWLPASSAASTKNLSRKLAKRKPLRAVFRDTGFGSDASKINVEQIFKLLSPGNGSEDASKEAVMKLKFKQQAYQTMLLRR